MVEIVIKYVYCVTYYGEVKNLLHRFPINTVMHSTTGITSFKATYGMPPPSIATYLASSSIVEAVDTLLSSQHDLWKSLSTRLRKVQLAMKTQADRKRHEVSYVVDD